MAKFLDENGLLYLWQQIKARLAAKVDAEAGKGLSTNDYTTEEKTKLAGVEAGANKTVINATLAGVSDTEALAASQGKILKELVDAQANVIESISVNGTVQTVTGKGVNITVPTAVADLPDAGDYAKKSDLANVYQYKGSVAAYASLPAEGNTAGDVYNAEDTGMNYGWTGEEWDALGQVFTVETIANTEIDAILAA